MISINKIRERSGLLLIIVGLAMMAFILGDLFSSKPGQNAVNIGEISGENVEAADFEKNVALQEEALESAGQQMDENGREQLRNQVWNQFVRNLVLDKEFDKLGLDVSKMEYDDIRFGKNVLADFKNNQAFVNPATGQFDPEAVKRVFSQMQERAPLYWQSQRDQIIETRKMAKYNTLIRKGIYVNKIQSEAEYHATNDKVTANYVVGRFASIPDSTIKPTEDEVKAYFKKNKDLVKYKQQESRSIEFVSFDIRATGNDIQRTQEDMNALVEPFKVSTDDSSFVANNSDTKFFQAENYTKGSVDPATDSLISNGSKGTVVGPFVQGENLKLVKVITNSKAPEVNARHILLKPAPGETNEQLKVKADSIIKEIKKNNNFADVARAISTDGSAQSGGNLDWFGQGQMVKPFDEAAFKASKGELKVVETEFGVHILEVTDKREVDQVKLASIVRSMAPSKETTNEAYSKASAFSLNNNTTELFNKGAEKDKLNKQSAPNIAPSSKFIPGIQDPSQIIRWMNSAEVGQVSEPFEVGNQFVVVNLTLITEEGEPSFESVKDQMEREVIKEKKAATLAAKMKGNNLSTIASALGETVQTATDLTFNTAVLPNAGREPKVVGTAVALKKGTVSQPITGENGVYILQITQNTTAPATKDLALSKTEVAARYASRIDYAAFNALIENAKVKDYRYKFY
ncbi:MAG: peptidylprolyl isomerase [Bacteroidota bacterium]